MMNFMITIIVGLAFGYVFYKMKVPGGLMVGSVIGVAALNIFFGISYIPSPIKYGAQIMAGAFIGSTVEREDLKRLKYLIKPALILLTAYLSLNITLGFVIHFISPLNLMTSFMSSVPGGLTDIPLICADLGADPPKVTVMQFVRMVMGIGIFPTLIAKITSQDDKKYKTLNATNLIVPIEKVKLDKHNIKLFALTIAVAFVFGIIGKILNIPAGVLLFSMIGVISFKLILNKNFMPSWVKRIVQLLSGSYIGCYMSYSDILELKYLIFPSLLLIIGYSITCLIVGKLLNKYCNISLKEAMLIATPGGAYDMALIATDMGVQSTDIVVLQIIRLIVVISVYPQVFRLIEAISSYL